MVTDLFADKGNAVMWQGNLPMVYFVGHIISLIPTAGYILEERKALFDAYFAYFELIN